MRHLTFAAFVFSCLPSSAQSIAPLSASAPVIDERAARAAAATDYIIVEGHAVQIPETTTGSGIGAIYWLRTTGAGATISTGVQTSSIAGSRWTVGNAGVAFHPRDGFIVHTQARIGGGHRTNHRSFGYRMYEGGLAYRATPRLHIMIDEQYWRVGASRGHLIKPGLSFSPRRRWSADVAYARSAGGNLDASLAIGRVGFAMRTVTIIGGAAAGHSAPEVFDATFAGTTSKSLNEKFAGVQLQLPRAQVTLVGSDLSVSSVHKRTLAANVKYRLRAK